MKKLMNMIIGIFLILISSIGLFGIFKIDRFALGLFMGVGMVLLLELIIEQEPKEDVK